MQKLFAALVLMTIPALTFAQGKPDDLSIQAPKTETRTISGWRPVAWSVDTQSKVIVVKVVGLTGNGANQKEVPATDTVVMLLAGVSKVEGYAVTGLNVPPRCSEKYSLESAMAIRQSFALIKKCLDK